MHRIFTIIELMREIALYLGTKEWVALVSVSQCWNLVTIPLLWREVDFGIFASFGILERDVVTGDYRVSLCECLRPLRRGFPVLRPFSCFLFPFLSRVLTFKSNIMFSGLIGRLLLMLLVSSISVVGSSGTPSIGPWSDFFTTAHT